MRDGVGSTQNFSYRIRSNYRKVRLGFSKLLGNILVKYAPNKGTFLRKISRELHERIIYNAYTIFVSDCLYKCCGYSFELPGLVPSTTHNICFYKEVDTNTWAVT